MGGHISYFTLLGHVAKESTVAVCRDSAESAAVILDIDMAIFEDLSRDVQAGIREKMTSAAYKEGEFGEPARTTLYILRHVLNYPLSQSTQPAQS